GPAVALLAAAVAWACPAWAQVEPPPRDGADHEDRLGALEARLEEQARQIEALRAYVDAQRAGWQGADGLDESALGDLRARGGDRYVPPPPVAASLAAVAAQQDPAPVGQAPEE